MYRFSCSLIEKEHLKSQTLKKEAPKTERADVKCRSFFVAKIYNIYSPIILDRGQNMCYNIAKSSASGKGEII